MTTDKITRFKNSVFSFKLKMPSATNVIIWCKKKTKKQIDHTYNQPV